MPRLSWVGFLGILGFTIEEKLGRRIKPAMIKLVGIAIFIGYVVGIFKFWKGYTATNFNRSLPTRIALSLLWPVLFIANAGYRKNFGKALRGR